MGRLDGKVALITGAARGLGAATAELFAGEGAKVAVTDVSAQGKETAAALGDAGLFVDLDVTDAARWEAAVGCVKDRFGRLDVLVNNAAVFNVAPLVALDEQDYRRVIDINQVGTFLGMRAVIPSMIEAGGGSVINVSSIDGVTGTPGNTAYVASKFAVVGMTKVAALEYAAAGVRVNCINPGPIETPMLEDPHVKELAPNIREIVSGYSPVGRLAEPKEIANLMLWLASDEASYCTGSDITIDGGWIAGYRLG